MMPTNQKIILDMTETKMHQKQLKHDRWNGYNVRIIKDVEDSVEVLRCILLKRRQYKDMINSQWK